LQKHWPSSLALIQTQKQSKESINNTMPLIKSTSKKAFTKNVKKEIAAGKPPKQAVAIAYSTKRAAASKKGKSK
jgi:hypothetical protein